MSHMFNVTRGRQPKNVVNARKSIAREFGCAYHYIHDPGNGWIGWYSGPNRGNPFDGDLEGVVKQAECERGLLHT